MKVEPREPIFRIGVGAKFVPRFHHCSLSMSRYPELVEGKRLFIFNPFRVGVEGQICPQVSPGAIHIQPFQGWRQYLIRIFASTNQINKIHSIPTKRKCL